MATSNTVTRMAGTNATTAKVFGLGPCGPAQSTAKARKATSYPNSPKAIIIDASTIKRILLPLFRSAQALSKCEERTRNSRAGRAKASTENHSIARESRFAARELACHVQDGICVFGTSREGLNGIVSGRDEQIDFPPPRFALDFIHHG